jgi:DNA repair exonuclease SbcCD ATPase subunit
MGTTAHAGNDQTTIDELSENAQALTEKLGDYTAEQREEAIESIRETLRALDARIGVLDEELTANWDSMSEATRENARESLEALRAQREKVAKWYERLQASSSSAWNTIREDFTEAYDAFSEAWRDAEQEVESGESEKLENSI